MSNTSQKPTVAMTMGDPAGIGPEICALAALSPAVTDGVNTFVIGDAKRMEEAVSILAEAGRFHARPTVRSIQEPGDATYQPGVIEVLNLGNVPSGLPWGELSAAAGQ